MKNENTIIWLIYFKIIRQQIKFTQKVHFQENLSTETTHCVFAYTFQTELLTQQKDSNLFSWYAKLLSRFASNANIIVGI